MATSTLASQRLIALGASSRAPRSVCTQKAFSGKPLVQPKQISRTSRRIAARSASTDDSTVDVDGIVKDLQDKWDRVENKTSVAVYAGGAVVALWLSSTIVGAVNAVPLLPKLLELVGLGYTSWFVYRYLLFKSSREELLEDIEELKKKISGAAQDTTGKKPPSIS